MPTPTGLQSVLLELQHLVDEQIYFLQRQRFTILSESRLLDYRVRDYVIRAIVCDLDSDSEKKIP